MARKPRVEFEGATYHVMCRGNRQVPIFKDDRDHDIFLDMLGEVSERNGWLIHAFVLMGNHYHLLIETPEANLVDGMRWFQGTYTQRFNIRHKEWGHLFQGRYKALLVDDGEYFRAVADSIHLNPARAHCFDLKKGRLTDYKWSSFCGYLRPTKRPGFLAVDRVLGNHGFADEASGRSQYRHYMKKRVLEILHSKDPREADEKWRKIRRGWVFGTAEFCIKMRDAVEGVVYGKRRDSFMGEEIRLHDETEAESLLQFGLNRCGIVEADLPMLKKGDDRKKVVAWLIRKKTGVRVEWITSRLSMGTPSNFARYIRAVEKADGGELLRLKHEMTN